MKTIDLALTCILLPLALTACNSTDTPPVDELTGYWQQIGYGKYLDVGADQVILYEASPESCIVTQSISRDEFPTRLNWTIQNSNAEQFLANEYGIADYPVAMNRMAALPSSCGTPLSITPTNVVNHLVAMTQHYYAFFERRQVDWQAAAATAKSAVSDEMTDAQLTEVLIQLLSVIDDNHVLLHAAPIDLYNPELSIEAVTQFGHPNDFGTQILSEYLEFSPELPLEEYYGEQLGTYYTTVFNYLTDGVKAPSGQNNGLFFWGTMGDNVGYLHIGELDNFDPNFAGTGEENVDKHLAALDSALDEAISDLQHTTTIILDFRMHTGGTTTLDRAVARRFIGQEINYGSYSISGGESASLDLSPYNGLRFAQPTILITSNANQSSGEDMVMALKADFDTTQIGETTLGIFSDMLFLSLPNQWAFSLSNQIWLDREGISWEGIGLRPDIEFDVFPLTDRQQGIDSALDKALELSQF